MKIPAEVNRRNLSQGFSLLETLLVVTIFLAVGAAAVPMVNSAMRNSRVETALENVVQELRLARQLAMDGRRTHTITFNLPVTITTAQQGTGGNPPVQVRRLTLPSELQFVRNAIASEPDQMNTIGAVSLNGTAFVNFNPDGSAVDGAGALCNGVVYIGIPGDLATTRAVTLFGSTGRVRGYRYAESAGTWGWR